VHGNSVIAPGLESFSSSSAFQLKRWAKLGRPSGAGFLDISERIDIDEMASASGFSCDPGYARNPFKQRGLQKYYKVGRRLLVLSK